MGGRPQTAAVTLAAASQSQGARAPPCWRALRAWGPHPCLVPGLRTVWEGSGVGSPRSLSRALRVETCERNGFITGSPLPRLASTLPVTLHCH